MKEYYKITEVARLYGLCTDTLRYYEEQGLLHPHRSEAGYRLYSIDDICNLNVIRALRELDMPVEHMRRYFGERTVASTLDMLDEQDAAIRARIAALRDARAAVDARRARLERYDGQEPGLLRLLELPERPCLQLQEDVILEGKGIQQVEILEYKAQILPPEGGQTALGDGGEILAVQKDLAGGGPVQGRQNVEKRRLSGAGFPHNGHKLPGFQVKGDVGEGLHLIAAEAGGVNFLQIVYFQSCHMLGTSLVVLGIF